MADGYGPAEGEHVCSRCDNDTGHSVDLSGLSDRCAYREEHRRCPRPAAYVVGLVYCVYEHCLYDPAHSEDCGEDHSTTHVCVEHGITMRTREDLWQCFRTIRSMTPSREGVA